MRISLRSDVFLALSTELECHSTYQYRARQRLFRLSGVNILVNTHVCVPTVTHSKQIDLQNRHQEEKSTYTMVRELTCHSQSQITGQWILPAKARLWIQPQLYEEQDEWDHSVITHQAVDQPSRALEILRGRGQSVNGKKPLYGTFVRRKPI